VLAYAKIFIASAATALKRLGVVMVGAVGPVTLKRPRLMPHRSESRRMCRCLA
jgi:hypothetical protein